MNDNRPLEPVSLPEITPEELPTAESDGLKEITDLILDHPGSCIGDWIPVKIYLSPKFKVLCPHLDNDALETILRRMDLEGTVELASLGKELHVRTNDEHWPVQITEANLPIALYLARKYGREPTKEESITTLNRFLGGNYSTFRKRLFTLSNKPRVIEQAVDGGRNIQFRLIANKVAVYPENSLSGGIIYDLSAESGKPVDDLQNFYQRSEEQNSRSSSKAQLPEARPPLQLEEAVELLVRDGHMIIQAEEATISWANQRTALCQQVEALLGEIEAGNERVKLLLADPKLIAVRQADEQITEIKKILQAIL